MSVSVYYLADKPEYKDACAAWGYGRWGVQKKESSLQKAQKRMEQGAQKEALPLTVVAVDHNTNLPVGMGSLWSDDGDLWAEHMPWIAAVFTLYRYRGQGVAQKIMDRLEAEAKRLGYNEVFLKAGSAAGYYPKLGYEAVETKDVPTCAVGQETLFRKKV